jgi:zinc protease
LVIVGDFDSSEMVQAVEASFGAIPAQSQPEPRGNARDNGPVPSGPTIEPRQEGQRRVELRKAGQQELLTVAYHTPRRAHADSIAMDVLAQILGHGRTSRLYRALVETGLAVHASAENQAMSVDPFLFFLDLEIAPGSDAARAEAALDAEIQRLQRELVSEPELQRARKQARVGFVMRRDSASALAFLIGEFEVASGWRQLEEYLHCLDSVGREDLQRAATHYLMPSKRTLGHFRPNRGDPAETADSPEG